VRRLFENRVLGKIFGAERGRDQGRGGKCKMRCWSGGIREVK
jgi:hypothetical protein